MNPDQGRQGDRLHTDPTSFNALLLASTRQAFENARRGGIKRLTLPLLGKSLRALREHNLVECLRWMDRAWRTNPEDSAVLASIYGRLLSLEGSDHDAALRVLRRVSDPAADVAALAAHALLHLDRSDEANRALSSALVDFCVTPGGLLAHVASEIMRHPSTRASGWMGRNGDLEFVGELMADEPVHALQIRLDTGAEFIQPIKPLMQQGRRAFHFKLPPGAASATLQVASRGIPLLGSSCRALPEFGLDGRASSTGCTIYGWVRLKWLAQRPLALRIEDEQNHRFETTTRSPIGGEFRWPFRLDLRRRRIPGSRIDIRAQLPDGEWRVLPAMPLLLDKAVRLPGRTPAALSRWRPNARAARSSVKRKRPGVDVIIPVYRGRRETLACIQSVLATAKGARVVVVDDATDDSVLAEALDELAADRKITLLRNAANLGFAASVNRALAVSRARDAVLLNSDAVVFGDWLERLRQAAYRNPNTGTITPFSNSGSIASYPRTSQESMSVEDAAAVNRLAGATHAGISIEIPVGVGFCIYMRRDCLNQVGPMDASVFGAGYGEETDFCLRARHRGWSHRLAADVFVYHGGARSFGAAREALIHRSQRLLNLRHSGFDRFIAEFLEKDTLGTLRRQLDERRLAAFAGPFVLLVTLALAGGVARFVDERCRKLRSQGLFPLVLRPRTAGDSRRCELWTDALEVPNLQYRVPDDLAALTALLRLLPIEAVEIEHFLHLDSRVVEAVRTLDVPYDIVVHDYAWICPRVTLIDGSGRYCGEPPITVCAVCVKRNGSNLDERISVSDLRERSRAWLSQARRVAAPSADAAARLQRYFNINVEVRQHAQLPTALPARIVRSKSATVRVAIIGAIGVHKGYKVLLQCARDAKARKLPLEFIVIGHTEDDAALLKTGTTFITGPYSEGETPYLLRRERPDIAFMPSVWPETWCYTLDDALGAGLPVMAFDLGAIAERLRNAGVGVLLPLGSSAQLINDRLLQWGALIDEKTALAQPRDVDIMQKTEEKAMNNPAVGTSMQQEALSASVQVLPLSPGLYLFSVKAAAASPGKTPGRLQLPAMHVGLGPGVRSDQVEFLAGPTTNGAWLFAKEDSLVTKVTGAGATLVLTSVRAPGGETLAITVERLDGRAELPAAHASLTRPSAGAMPAAGERPDIRPDFAVDTVPILISAHIRTRGDLSFSDANWAGRIASGLWIESFSIRPLQRFEPQDIEYKGLTGSGFETPWVSDGNMCGTKGMAVPLVGFAIRLKPSKEAAEYDCEYSGFFQSGLIVGPLRNGTPCRSTVANDPLEGIQMRIRKRSGAAPETGKSSNASQGVKGQAKVPVHAGPSFGRYRDANGNGAGAAASASKRGDLEPRGPPAKRTAPSARKPTGRPRVGKRSITRRT